ncbi:MAG: DUF1207 domain-containing protein [Bacteroidota bacterium]|nr:DUF1207 domain-containing protein [Candidatus Kapabacteria bacterium]MCS7302431.1 DUF1207 domain-containing protein [Candidatus Kapabacteria bacterium]MCX7937095.1 DUF1207 domain-containing protein [Chlorobiota bacterium]MDW8074588.1 DUF1207 domain-containing protein [Bacteroidota bacterium]MDW8270936.1 DUF1207 domain-containing protein [Bacteroidota bacterium]
MSRQIIVALLSVTLSSAQRIDSIYLAHTGSPSALVFRPLLAAIFEPRMGSQYTSLQRLRLDIGYSADVFSSYAGTNIWAIGVDAFTYTRLRAEPNLKFPVETIDYMFGINTSHCWGVDSAVIGMFRLRLSHISAHFADGLADTAGVLEERPFVYSREFADGIIAVEWQKLGIRLYGGGTFLFSVKELPAQVSRVIPQGGIEWYGRAWLPIAIGYDIRMVGVDNRYVPSHAFQIAAEIVRQNTSALAFCGYWYSGYSIHGMFFKRREQYFAVGVQVLF